MTILLKRSLEAGLIEIRDNPRGTAEVFGMKISPKLLTITDKGRQLIDELGLMEL